MRIAALHRKLLRDLLAIWSQAAAIAAVAAAGVALYVVLHSTFYSLDLIKQTYYERYRFADIFDSLTRAPERVAGAIAAIPGVAGVSTRVAALGRVDIPALTVSATARVLSVPDERTPLLNDLYLRAGRFLGLDALDEVLVHDSFARAHGLEPGALLPLTVKGTRRNFRVVGIALSPEYVYAIQPGGWLPDDKRFVVLWMRRTALADLADMKGSFNDVSVSLSPGASGEAVMDRLDEILEPYGGLGAMPRSEQSSNFYLESELQGLHAIGRVLPAIFLGVAAFLVNVVLRRMVMVQRSQIATIKALGYGNGQVAFHYAAWAVVIAATGGLLGVLSGVWLGRLMTGLYSKYFNFPVLEYILPPGITLEALAICLGAALLGALWAVRRSVGLPPAEAMRPQAPVRFRQSLAEWLGFAGWASVPLRIVLRNVERHLGRAVLSLTGMAAGGALVVAGNFTLDAMDEILELRFGVVARQDATLIFVNPVRGENELRRLPGVLEFEPFRSVPARFHHTYHHRTGTITALVSSPRLRRVVDSAFQAKPLPPRGLVLSKKLAEILGVHPGDQLSVEVLEGKRTSGRVLVAEVVEEYLGTDTYMAADALHRFLGESPLESGAFVRVDPAAASDVYRTLERRPGVAAVTMQADARQSLEGTLGETTGMLRTVTVLFAVIIAFGVIYNNARISLSERDRELATLQVLGFTRGEIAFILLGEFGILTALAIPVGLALGYGIAALLVEVYDTEMFRLPLIVFPRTYALAAATQMGAAAISALMVGRKLRHLDLVAVLKQTE